MECSRCHKKLSNDELDAGFNSSMYESKFCLSCMNEQTPDDDEYKTILENEEEN